MHSVSGWYLHTEHMLSDPGMLVSQDVYEQSEPFVQEVGGEAGRERWKEGEYDF